MRKQVFMMNQSESNLVLNENWYVFYYISVIDILTFLLDKKGEIKMSIDINSDKVLKQSGFLLKKRINRKFINYGNNYYFTLDRDSYINKTIKKVGTTLIFSENTTLSTISEKDLFDKIKQNDFNNNLDFDVFFSVHDFDWEIIAYFKHKDLLSEFINYINQKSNLQYAKFCKQFE